MAGKGFLRVVAHHGAGMLLALGLMGAATAAQAATVKVAPDKATLVTVAGKPATLIVGNPLYADAAAIGNKILVQGRNYGTTNVIVLDAKGRQLAHFDVVVAPAKLTGQMIVYKEGRRYTYACNPTCARQLDTSDNPEDVLVLEKILMRRQELITTIMEGGGGGGGSAPQVVSPQ